MKVKLGGFWLFVHSCTDCGFYIEWLKNWVPVSSRFFQNNHNANDLKIKKHFPSEMIKRYLVHLIHIWTPLQSKHNTCEKGHTPTDAELCTACFIGGAEAECDVGVSPVCVWLCVNGFTFKSHHHNDRATSLMSHIFVSNAQQDFLTFIYENVALHFFRLQRWNEQLVNLIYLPSDNKKIIRYFHICCQKNE